MLQQNSTTVPSLRHDKILLTLKEILSKAIGISPSEIDIHTHFLEMGVDSIVLLQISRAIQDRFGLKIPFALLLETLSTINALAIHLDRELPTEEPSYQESMPNVTPQVWTESPFSIQAPKTPKKENSIAGTGIEQIMAQQLMLMSKQLELLRQGNSSEKALPSIPLLSQHQNGQQVAQNSTTISVSQASQSPSLPSTTSQPIEKQVSGVLNPRQQKHLDSLIKRFNQRTQESKRLTQAYRAYHANGRAVSQFLPSIKEIVYPIHGQRGEGARIWDVDGNEYVDISMGFGTLLFGHSPSFIVEAIQKYIEQGLQNGPQSPLAGKVAQLICELTGAERVAFCNDGTEAVMGAIRLARAATGRSKIALFTGSYHGTFDGVLVKGVATGNGTLRSVPGALGIPSYIAEDAIMLDYDSPQSLEILNAHAHELAAILVEPVQSSRPDFQPKEFLHQLRQLTQETGIVLIFDEVITGFRMHSGGIQALWGIQADITTYGKAVGVGIPMGVIAGKAAFMDALDGGFWSYGDASYPQAETTSFAGTFFKHPLAMAVAWAALNHIKNNGSKLQEELSQKTARLAETLNGYFEQNQVPIRVVHFGSLFRFTAQNNFKFLNLFFYHLLEKGVYVWEGRTLYLSTAHTEEDIEQVIRVVKESVVELQNGEFLPASFILKNAEKLASDRTSKSSNNQIYTSSNLSIESSFSSEHASRNGDTASVVTVPMTEAQKEIWFMAQMGNNASRAYNLSRTIHLRGSANLDAMRKAVQEIVNRHEALRTTFSPEGDYQRIHSTLTIDIPLSDLSTLDSKEREAKLSELLAQEAQQIFDLERGPLLCAHIVKLEEEHHLLVITNHHIVADGWSVGILQQELSAIYLAECQGIAYQLPEAKKLSDYARQQALLQQSSNLVNAEAYWLKQFSGDIPVLELPTDRPRPPVFTHAGARQTMAIATPLYNDLKSLSAECKCTLFTTLLAAYTVFLHRLTAQNDIIVGIDSAGQLSAEGGYLVGHCVNLLPIRIQINGNPTFIDHLKSVKQVLLEGYEHQIYPFIKLVKNLNLPRDSSRSPLLTTTFNLDKERYELGDLSHTVELVKNSTDAAQYDISWNISQTASELIVECDYSTDLFDASTIQRWMRHYKTLLESIVANCECSLSDLPLLTKTERQQLLVEWNDTQADYPKEQCIHTLFESQVKRTPNAVAAVFDNQTLTYQELNIRANQLAHHLRQLGVKPEVLVGICMERSLEMVVGLLGILKAGGAYVPLDPAYPQERLALMLSDAQVSVLLTQQALMDVLPDTKARVVCLDRDWQDIARESQENPVSGITAHNLAYVIYTSGSTGKPKGVQIAHQSLTNFLTAMSQQLGLTNQDILLSVTTISFDIAALELYLPLILGAQLVLTRRAEAADGTQLLEKLVKSGATVMQATPATWRLLLAAGWQGTKQLKILCGGEALPKALANQLLEKGSCLWNLYGPTETTIWSAMCKVEANHRDVGSQNTPEPIGRPIANTQIYILDRHLQPVPIGVPGELHIGGDGLARGYLNRPELTAEKFIPHPFSNKPGARLYKTGDLARYLPDGAIEFLGRIDHQVKVRGFRIELGEIEAVLNQHPGVQASVVVLRDDEPNNQRLVAYGVPHPEQDITVDEVRGFLKQKLPDYMVPSAFVLLEALPLTPNGKVDRRALPSLPEGQRPELNVGYVMPRTEMEQAVADIWQDILDIEQVGVYDNFFDLGGHSLLATQLISRYRQAFQVELPLNLVFESPTVADQALAIEQSQPIEENNSIPAIALRCPEEAIASGAELCAIPRRDYSYAEQLATLDQALDQEVDSLLQQLLAQEDIQP